MSMGRIIVAGIISEVIYLYAFFIGDLLNSPIDFLLCHLALSAIYLPVVYLSVRHDSSGAKFDRRIMAVIGFAVVFRLTLFGMTPTLSDDIYRYVWDGKVLLSGENPYRYPPSAEPIAHLRDDFFDKINHKNIGTPYTPLTELVFASATRFTPPVQAMKLPFIIFDLLTILVLFRLLKILKRSPLAITAYAWNPLVIFEIAGSGHADSLAVLFLILSLTLLTAGKRVYGSFTFAFALISKYFAAAALPVMLRRLGAREWLAVFGILIVFYAPFLEYVENHFISIHAVASTWRFNDSLFSLFEWITGSDAAAQAVSAIIFTGICVLVYFRDGPAVYSAYILIGSMLLLSNTVHPWYMVWIVPFMAVYPSPAWLYLTASMPLSYLLLEGQGYSGASEIEYFVKGAIYVPFFLLLALRTILGRLRTADARGFKEAL
jgi:hypothetical protein